MSVEQLNIFILIDTPNNADLSISVTIKNIKSLIEIKEQHTFRTIFSSSSV